jgi:hypothetical protein
MRNKLALYLVPMLAAASTGFAQFEGVMEMKVTMTGNEGGKQGNGTLKLAVSRAGARNEMNMQMEQMTMKMVMLFKNDSPDTMYRINDADKTYSVVDLAKLRQMAGPGRADEKFTVKKLGEEEILGYKTQHVLVTGRNNTTELWTAKDLFDYGTFSKLQARAGRAGNAEAMNKALKDAHAEGMPLRSIATAPDGGKVTMEVVKAEKQSLPASTFEIPPGYTKSAGGMMDMMGGMSGLQADEAKKKMDEALKNMSPEQREMIEKMMKQRQGGNP